MHKVPFLDLGRATQELRSELDQAYHRFMSSGHYVLGDEVHSFEEEYASYCGAKYCVGVGTGLDALVLSLRAMGIAEGDEVIVPSNTYIATWLAVSQVGAVIVPVDPAPYRYYIDVDQVQGAITARTRAVLPVTLYGIPFNYDAMLSLARERKIKVVVDNAQGHGARFKGRNLGGLADIECHSFYPSKNLGAYGEGGAITTNSEELADCVRVLRNYGSRIRYHNEVCGTNARLDSLQSAFLRVKLRHLDQWNDRRRDLAQQYLDGLRGVDDVITPVVPEWADPCWHLFVIRTSARDHIQRKLAENGIETLVHYPIPPHESAAYEHLSLSRDAFPLGSQLANEVLSLPLNPHMSAQDVNYVCQAVRSAAAQ